MSSEEIENFVDSMDSLQGATGGEPSSKLEKKARKKSNPGWISLVKAAGLNDKTVELLSENGFDSIEALKCLDSDCVKLLPDLPLGQRLLLQKAASNGWDAKPKNRLPAAATNPTKKEESTFTEGELAGLLQGMGVDKPAITQPEEDIASKFTPHNFLAMHVPVKDRKTKKLNRAHEFIVGKPTGQDLNLREMMLGNLLILENMVMLGEADILGYVKHLSYMMQKAVQNNSTESLLEYDYAVRDKLEQEGGPWPLQSDTDLTNRHIRLYIRGPSQQNGSYKQQASNPKPSASALGNRCMRWNNSPDGSGCPNPRKCIRIHECIACHSRDHPLARCPVVDRAGASRQSDTASSRGGK